ncbi:MAG: hypothetical protein CMA70_04870 [Euryarchaeota archaeon]|nr:hypothetical protein [Euryarchaeota archaeon]
MYPRISYSSTSSISNLGDLFHRTESICFNLIDFEQGHCISWPTVAWHSGQIAVNRMGYVFIMVTSLLILGKTES